MWSCCSVRRRRKDTLVWRMRGCCWLVGRCLYTTESFLVFDLSLCASEPEQHRTSLCKLGDACLDAGSARREVLELRSQRAAAATALASADGRIAGLVAELGALAGKVRALEAGSGGALANQVAHQAVSPMCPLLPQDCWSIAALGEQGNARLMGRSQ